MVLYGTLNKLCGCMNLRKNKVLSKVEINPSHFAPEMRGIVASHFLSSSLIDATKKPGDFAYDVVWFLSFRYQLQSTFLRA